MRLKQKIESMGGAVYVTKPGNLERGSVFVTEARNFDCGGRLRD